MAGMSYPELSLKEPALAIVVVVLGSWDRAECNGVRTDGETRIRRRKE